MKFYNLSQKTICHWKAKHVSTHHFLFLEFKRHKLYCAWIYHELTAKYLPKSIKHLQHTLVSYFFLPHLDSDLNGTSFKIGHL